MPHFRVDDGLHNHPKARKAGLEAMGLWSVSGSWAMNYGTDGFVPEWYVKTWPRGATLAKRLVSAGLWHPGEHDGDKGWWFHEFIGPGRNDSRAQIEADRESARQRKATQRGRASPPPSTPESRRDTPRDRHRDSQRDSQAQSHRTPGYTQPLSTNSPNAATVALGGGSGGNPPNPVAATAAPSTRGHRLPADWTPDQDVIAQMSNQHPSVDLRAEHDKFLDYWHAKPGKDARKTDWNLTWRNWIRRAAEQKPAPNQPENTTAFERKKARNGAVFASLADDPETTHNVHPKALPQ